MADLPEPAYVAGLATSLRITHPNTLQTAEDELARLRGVLARVTTWIHNPTHDADARTALANDLGLPTPRTHRDTT